MVPSDMHCVLRVASLHVELPRCLGNLFENEIRIKPDSLTLDDLPRLTEQLDRLGLDELHADLGHDAAPPVVDGVDRIGSKELVPGHLVDEHRHLIPLGITARLIRVQVSESHSRTVPHVVTGEAHFLVRRACATGRVLATEAWRSDPNGQRMIEVVCLRSW